jgi:hypothetical protein
MELWNGVSYESVMGMPITRRKRLITKKADLERRRQAEHDSAMARAKSRSRR